MREDRRALEHVLELANVSGPAVGHHRSMLRALTPCSGLPSLRDRPVTKNATSSGMSPAAFAERWHVDREDVQAIQQIGAERPAADRLCEVAIGGCDHAHVDVLRPAAADRLELLLLEHAQQLHLRIERQLTDLVEEDCAAVGDLEPADALVDGAGEGALDVAEQLALDQPRSDRAAVDLDQRPVAARAAAVHARGEELLAGAGLADDQHGGIRRRDRSTRRSASSSAGCCRRSR